MSDVTIWPPAVIRERAARVAELDARVAAAEREKRLSARRLERVRAEIIRPLHATGKRNKFADMIRNSLLEGYER